jgi:hypothetical protein
VPGEAPEAERSTSMEAGLAVSMRWAREDTWERLCNPARTAQSRQPPLRRSRLAFWLDKLSPRLMVRVSDRLVAVGQRLSQKLELPTPSPREQNESSR